MFYNLRPLLGAPAVAVVGRRGGRRGRGSAATPVATGDSHPAADLIIRHARIWTVNLKQPQAEAVAVLNGRIAAVGSDAAVLPGAGPNTRVVDADGNRLLPGFNDAHVHFADGGAR